MARADLLCELIKAGLLNDTASFKKAAEAICAEERSKQHEILANKISELLRNTQPQSNAVPRSSLQSIGITTTIPAQFFIEKVPTKRLDQLLLPEKVSNSCRDLIEEQTRADILRSYGMEPMNKVLLVGPPGNGKTSVAEAIAEALMVPLLTVRYESIIGAYLGETATRLSKLFDYAKTRHCVLFFDEFDTIGKERG